MINKDEHAGRNPTTLTPPTSLSGMEMNASMLLCPAMSLSACDILVQVNNCSILSISIMDCWGYLHAGNRLPQQSEDSQTFTWPLETASHNIAQHSSGGLLRELLTHGSCHYAITFCACGIVYDRKTRFSPLPSFVTLSVPTGAPSEAGSRGTSNEATRRLEAALRVVCGRTFLCDPEDLAHYLIARF